MKRVIEILMFCVIIFFTFLSFINFSFAQVVDLSNIAWDNIKNVSIVPIWWGNTKSEITNLSFSVLHTIKLILGWVILIYIVYIWIQMIMAMWAEDKLKWSKNQLYYTLLAFLFINIPGQLYDMFSGKNDGATRNVTESTTYKGVDLETSSNIIVNFWNWNLTMGDWVIPFVKALLAWVVIIMLIIAWINLIMSKWDEEKRKKAKWRFLYSGFWLVFLWVIEAWTRFAYTWEIKTWQWIFAQLMNLAIFFAGPTVIVFLIYGWFLFITSSWDEAKSKKWIAILKNTFLAVIILLASYTFLKDLVDFVV